MLSRSPASVESGLQSLAQEIVTKSVAQDRTSIAVLPFPNSDGTCSVLSTYLADELIQALFTIPNSPLTIIERNQLEAIINEIQIGAGGLLNPETTQSLGKVSGVKALTVGTITQIGDRVRINARLVATDTGRTISAAAISIPRTGDIDSLLRQPVAGEGGTCGVHVVVRPRGAEDSEAKTGKLAPVPSASTSVPARAARSTTAENLLLSVQSVARSANKKSIAVIISLTNLDKDPVRVILTAPKPTLLDDSADLGQIESVNGLQICRNWEWQTAECRAMARSVNWTTLSPNTPVNLLFRFVSGDASFSGSVASITATILKRSSQDFNNVAETQKSIVTVPVSFTDMTIRNATGP